jgi:tetratricopeptide (TPR) repeat protein
VVNRAQALELGRQTEAAIVTWGRIDKTVFEVTVTAIKWATIERVLPSLPAEELYDFSLRLSEQVHIEFVTEYTLCEVLYLERRSVPSREMLLRALNTAQNEDLERSNPQEIAKAYFFLGFLFTDRLAPDLEQAVIAYSKAIDLDSALDVARINRALVYAWLGRTDEARAAYTRLIDAGSSLALQAYLSRAGLQPTRKLAEHDYEAAIQLDPLKGLISRGHQRLRRWDDPLGAVQDFQQALELNPGDPYRYDDLGQAQLIAGQSEAAMQTYSDAIPYVTPEVLETIAETLESLAKYDPDLQEPITTILSLLHEAQAQ